VRYPVFLVANTLFIGLFAFYSSRILIQFHFLLFFCYFWVRFPLKSRARILARILTLMTVYLNLVESFAKTCETHFSILHLIVHKSFVFLFVFLVYYTLLHLGYYTLFHRFLQTILYRDGFLLWCTLHVASIVLPFTNT